MRDRPMAGWSVPSIIHHIRVGGRPGGETRRDETRRDETGRRPPTDRGHRVAYIHDPVDGAIRIWCPFILALILTLTLTLTLVLVLVLILILIFPPPRDPTLT
ncbi:hypothetical protein RJ55_00736 [Drechmeria coniospora]|nr:hypothetical protein RJ55_00736 [Drechmeria coniospora]